MHFLKVFFLTFSLSLLKLAFALEGPVVQSINLEKVFVPDGFDSNDSVELIVKGILPALCYKNPKVSVEKLGDKILISASALYYPDIPCSEMVLPFVQTVDIGLLSAKAYEILLQNKEGSEATREILNIKQAPSQRVNDYVYANVETIIQDFDNIYDLTLIGHNPSDCYELDRVIIENEKNENGVITVLPILKKIREFCPLKMTPFYYKVTIPNDISLNSGKLLHVRRMDGRSVNRIID